MNQHIESVILQFDIPDGAWTAEPYGNGHINDTYLITTEEKRFILQRVNNYVFPKPENVIENIERVTAFLKALHKKIPGACAPGIPRYFTCTTNALKPACLIFAA